MESLGQPMAFVREKPYGPAEFDASVTAKTTLARYRGAACGTKYAEAVWAMQSSPAEIF